MRSIIIRNSAAKHKTEIFNAIERAYGFMCSRYGYHFDNIDFIFSTSFCRSRYYRNNEHSKYKRPTVQIAVRHRLYLYERKTLGYSANGLPIGFELQMACAIVHELTHHMQHEKNRNRGEVETTANEIDFLMLSGSGWEKYLTKLI